MKLGALDGTRLELLSVHRVVQAVREEDGAVALEVLRVVVSSSTWPCAEQVLEALADLPEALGEQLVDESPELEAVWVVQRERRVEASELREVSHDQVDVLPVPTCSSTQVKAECAAAVERRWSGGGAVVTASARDPSGLLSAERTSRWMALGCRAARMAPRDRPTQHSGGGVQPG